MNKKIARLLKKGVERIVFSYEGAIRENDLDDLLGEIMIEIDEHFALFDGEKTERRYEYSNPDILSDACIQERPAKKKVIKTLDIAIGNHALKRHLETLEAWDIKPDLLQAWIRNYPEEFLEGEFKKAMVWVIANRQKAPKKNYGAFFTSWLTRSWEKHRKTLPGNKATKAHPATLEFEE